MRAVAAAILALGALVVPGDAVAAVNCASGPDNALAITATEFADGVAIVRDGPSIRITDDVTGSPVTCPEPAPTVRSVDTIDVTAAGEESFLYLDLARGRLGPGVTAETERTSEIEVSAEWPSGFLGVGGGKRDDRISFGRGIGSEAGVTFGYLNSDPDPELTAPGVINVLVRGGGGDDVLETLGPFEDDGSNVFELRIPVTFEGGGGRDELGGGSGPDVLVGGGGNDLFFPGKGADDVVCGPGRDQVIAAGSKDRLRGCERVS